MDRRIADAARERQRRRVAGSGERAIVEERVRGMARGNRRCRSQHVASLAKRARRRYPVGHEQHRRPPLNHPSRSTHLRAGMVGMGMIFDETYRPFFEARLSAAAVRAEFRRLPGRTGGRGQPHRQAGRSLSPVSRRPHRRVRRAFASRDAVEQLLAAGVDFVCVATPDDRHFAAAKAALEAGKHVLIEKPSVLSLAELDELERWPASKACWPRSSITSCSIPITRSCARWSPTASCSTSTTATARCWSRRAISGSQFAEWITGRNPGTYVAVHYIKLIDFTFGGRLKTRALHRPARPRRPGRRPDLGLDPAAADLRVRRRPRGGVRHPHLWVTPDNFPGYVEQEVQFRFDNGVWNGHSRKRGVECTVEGRTPIERKITMNNHYNGTFLEPWGERSQRGYGIEVLERFVREVADVEFGGPAERARRAARRTPATCLQRPVGRPADRGRRAGDGSDSRPARRRHAELRGRA